MVALTRWLGAVLAVAGWLLLLAAPSSTTPTTDQTLDLEAGGGFAATIEVFLPSMALSAALLVVLGVCAALRRPDVGALVTGVTTAAFAGWVATRGYLMDYFPGLGIALAEGAGLGLVGLLLGVLAWKPRPAPAPAPDRAPGLTTPS